MLNGGPVAVFILEDMLEICESVACAHIPAHWER